MPISARCISTIDERQFSETGTGAALHLGK